MSGIWKSSVGKRMSIGGDWGLNYGGACKNCRISISITLLPLCLNSFSLSLNRLGLRLHRLDNIGMISVSVRESMVVCIGNSWGLNLNILDNRLDNRCGIDIGIVDIGAVDSIGQIVWISLRVSLGLTLLPFSLNSFSFGLNRLGDNKRITMITIGVRVDSMVPVVWISVGVWVGVCNGRCLNFHLLYNRFNQWGGINIWVVKTICQIVGISLSLSIGLSLLPQAIDLLEKMLEVDADKRIRAEQTLSHPYLAEYADPTDEPTSPLYDQTFEDYNLNIEEWKEKVWSEIMNFQEEMLSKNQ